MDFHFLVMEKSWKINVEKEGHPAPSLLMHASFPTSPQLRCYTTREYISNRLGVLFACGWVGGPEKIMDDSTE